MPNRVIREGILNSQRVNKLTEPAELFYRRLMSVVDDFGRFCTLVGNFRKKSQQTVSAKEPFAVHGGVIELRS